MTIEELYSDFPFLFHMAERGSWESIARHGLLSTTALLDLFEYTDGQRFSIESQHRPKSVTIKHPVLGTAVIRDQKPMSDSGLQRCLSDCTPEEWYRILNRHVFFWVTKERLLGLLKAQLYRNKEHDVITVDTRGLVAQYGDAIVLSPMNSGCTIPIPHPRSMGIFMPITSFPFTERRRTRQKRNALVELAVRYSVPDITRFVVRVERMHGDQVTQTIL